MNPADLQRRLDAAALPTEEATPADWERNVAMVRTRTRRRRVRGVVLAGLAAAAAVAVAVSWHPPQSSTRLVPAGPSATSSRLLPPESLQGVADRCAETRGTRSGVVPLFGGRADHVEAVLYRTADGELDFCSVFGGGTTAVGPVGPDGPAASDAIGSETTPRDSVQFGTYHDGPDLMVSAFGFVPVEVTGVVLALPDGRQVRADLDSGRWWAAAVVDGSTDFSQVRWTATDAQGAVVARGAGG